MTRALNSAVSTNGSCCATSETVQRDREQPQGLRRLVKHRWPPRHSRGFEELLVSASPPSQRTPSAGHVLRLLCCPPHTPIFCPLLSLTDQETADVSLILPSGDPRSAFITLNKAGLNTRYLPLVPESGSPTHRRCQPSACEKADCPRVTASQTAQTQRAPC